MNQTLGVIPARMSSSRFPNKPLEKILGIPMLAHCYERALLSQVCDHLVVATPDKEIINWANEYKVPVLLTSHDHERATERVAEVIDILETEGQFFQNILLLQGDEPQIHPDDVIKLHEAFHGNKFNVVNLVYPIEGDDLSDPNVVKVIISNSNSITFLTRSHVPHDSKKGIRQLGMIGFTNEALKTYIKLKMTPLEILESIDMMRFLENDISIQGVFASSQIIGVDKPSDIQKAEKMMKGDGFLEQYQKKYL